MIVPHKYNVTLICRSTIIEVIYNYPMDKFSILYRELRYTDENFKKFVPEVNPKIRRGLSFP